MKRKLQACAVLLLFGLAKIPLEQRVTEDLRRDKLLLPPLQVGTMENLGQTGLAASLGGLRGVAAALFQLRAHVEFTRVNWARVDELYKLVTRLQPRNAGYWDEASWHMAYNAASYYLYDESLKPALRGKLFDDHIKRGIEILHEGLKYMPNSPKLWERLGDIHFRRSYQFKDAGDAYWNSFQNGGLNFTERFAGFAYAQAADSESWKKGYAILKRLYDAKKETPGLIQYLKLVESKLHIPVAQRIPDAAPIPPRPVPMGPVQ